MGEAERAWRRLTAMPGARFECFAACVGRCLAAASHASALPKRHHGPRVFALTASWLAGHAHVNLPPIHPARAELQPPPSPDAPAAQLQMYVATPDTTVGFIAYVAAGGAHRLHVGRLPVQPLREVQVRDTGAPHDPGLHVHV
jgi:hypothetical protein